MRLSFRERQHVCHRVLVLQFTWITKANVSSNLPRYSGRGDNESDLLECEVKLPVAGKTLAAEGYTETMISDLQPCSRAFLTSFFTNLLLSVPTMPIPLCRR